LLGTRVGNLERLRSREPSLFEVAVHFLVGFSNESPMAHRTNLDEAGTVSFIGRVRELDGQASELEGLEPAEQLKRLCDEALKSGSAMIKNRLQHELQTIRRLGLDEFILSLWKLHRLAIHLGQLATVEGTAAGSLVMHLLGLCPINPLRHRLLFEFHLDPDQSFAPRRNLNVSGKSQTIIAEARRKFGWENNKENDKPYSGYCQAWQPPVGGTLDRATIDVVEHPALTVIRDTVKLIRIEHGSAAIPQQLPENDPATMALFREGKTEGIYGFDSRCTKELLRQVKPSRLDELTVVIGIDRTEIVAMGTVSKYLDGKNGRSEDGPLNGELEDVLAETHSVLLYWEQIAELVHRIGGLSLQDGRKLAMTLFKQRVEQVDQFRLRFVAGAGRRNVAPTVARAIFEVITTQGPFTFCKATAMSTAYVAYQLGYLKAHFPNEFELAALGKSQEEFWATFEVENPWMFVAERESWED
jgi:DNA polymerase III alpha subunit